MNTDDKPLPMITLDGVVMCRFSLFVTLYPGRPSQFRNGVREWTFRGDTFTQLEPKMIVNLTNLVKNHFLKYELMEMYDNSFQRNDPLRKMLRIFRNKIEKNVLFDTYAFALEKMFWPDWIKKVVHDKIEDTPR